MGIINGLALGGIVGAFVSGLIVRFVFRGEPEGTNVALLVGIVVLVSQAVGLFVVGRIPRGQPKHVVVRILLAVPAGMVGMAATGGALGLVALGLELWAPDRGLDGLFEFFGATMLVLGGGGFIGAVAGLIAALGAEPAEPPGDDAV